jgi:hypothetical protein
MQYFSRIKYACCRVMQFAQRRPLAPPISQLSDWQRASMKWAKEKKMPAASEENFYVLEQ